MKVSTSFLFSLLMSVALWFPSAAADTRESLEALLASGSFDPSQTAICVWDLDADCMLVAHNRSLPLTPASVMKCVTAGELAAVMPYSTTFDTQVFVDGTVSDGKFTGALIVRGSGDPSLGERRFPDHPDFTAVVARALKSKGISAFYGVVTVDDSLFSGPATHPSWDAADLDQAYGTGIHGFNFEGNASGKKSVRDPGAVFRRRLSDALRQEGISFSEAPGVTPTGNQCLLVTFKSPRAGDLMRSCMFRSDNLYAESFLRLFGLQNGSDGSFSMSAKMAMQHWDAMGFPLDGVEITDGSGLSRDNRLTADFLGAVLASRSRDPEYVAFFPLAGEEGTVKNFMSSTPLQGRLALKTGSMSGIQSYAGYLLDSDFMPTHVVVVMANGLKNRAAFRSALSKFFLSLFDS